MRRASLLIRRLDWWIVVPTAYLVVLGFVIQNAILFKTTGIELEFNLNSHVLAIAASFALAAAAAYFQPQKWQKAAWFLYVTGLVFLGLLLISGSSEAERWISVAGWRFQPTEVVKLAIIGVLAAIISRATNKGGNFSIILQSLAIIAVPSLLIALQPDLGSAVVFTAIWALMLVASSVRLSGLSLMLLIFTLVFVFTLPLLAPYQQDRISSFLNPSSDSQGTSYNSIQASIAIGSGGLVGRGLDSGTQSQLNFLPAQHTDFAFAVTAEKLGLIGATTVVLAMGAIMLRLTFLAWLTRNMYWRLILVGITGMLLAHTLINIGMNVGLLPVTGLPLPFISYGGTFLFATLTSVLLAIILSAHISKERET